MSTLTLEWQVGEQKLQRSLEPGRQLTIGRRGDCDVVVPATTVSRQHALIYSQQGVFVLRNLSRVNGIDVNERRKLAHHETIELRTGDHFFIGNIEFAVKIELFAESLKDVVH